jgi:hypothetical protein
VLGYAGSYQDALALRRSASAAGVGEPAVAQDGCGRLRVFLGGVAPADSDRLVAAARAAGLDPSLEHDPGSP